MVLRDGSVVNISFKNSEVPMSVPSTYIGLLTFTWNLSFKDLIPSSGLHDRPNTHELHLKGHMYTSTNINKSVLKICLKSLIIQRTHDNPSIWRVKDLGKEIQIDRSFSKEITLWEKQTNRNFGNEIIRHIQTQNT